MMAEKHTMASLNKQQLKRSLLSVRKVRAVKQLICKFS
jgi:hypothetical protein